MSYLTNHFYAYLSLVAVVLFLLLTSGLFGGGKDFSPIFGYQFYVEDILQGPISQDDPRLVQFIRWNHLSPPASLMQPYNLSAAPHEDTSMGQAKEVLALLKNKTGGFFVECGALDGETRSNTLFMERELGWEGLLVEADPDNVQLVKMKNRKAWVADVCLSTKPYPEKVIFRKSFNVGRIEKNLSKNESAGLIEVQCIPFYSLLLALNRTTVDYFSLDVEGDELNVLRTIPFDKIYIKTLSVEYYHVPEGEEAVRLFLEENGFVVKTKVIGTFNRANDFIAIRET